MNMFLIKELKPKKILVELTQAIATQKQTKHARKNSVVVAGESLLAIQESPELTSTFMDLCLQATVVLACRVSPKQKAQVVRMMRDRCPTKSTLSIGDGANDVNMITEAHIGVGIKGLEGAQAARAADYSIG
jgi:phospholipid-transporting ATPase